MRAHADASGLCTVDSVPPNYATKARSDALVRNMRQIHATAVAPGATVEAAPLAAVLALPQAVPQVSVSPTTRSVDASGRVAVSIGGRTVAQWLGWNPGTLTTSTNGHWVVCRHSGQSVPARRNSSSATVGADGRIRLPSAVLGRLGVGAGGEVMVLVVPERFLVAFCHPARVLHGAPLDLDD